VVKVTVRVTQFRAKKEREAMQQKRGNKLQREFRRENAHGYELFSGLGKIICTLGRNFVSKTKKLTNYAI
jgi:hypothetical protein